MSLAMVAKNKKIFQSPPCLPFIIWHLREDMKQRKVCKKMKTFKVREKLKALNKNKGT